MSATDAFSPKLRRVLPRLGSPEYDPVTVGSDDADVPITLYAAPLADECRVFFDDVYDRLDGQMLSDGTVKLTVRPIAPEMRMWVTAAAADVRHATSAHEMEDRASPADIAEFLHAVRVSVGEDAFFSLVKRACLVADNSMLTYDRLDRFARELDAEVDPGQLFAAVERGTHRACVREDSQHWIRRVGRAPIAGRVFVAGEPVREMTYDAIRDQIASAAAVSRLENQ